MNYRYVLCSSEKPVIEEFANWEQFIKSLKKLKLKSYALLYQKEGDGSWAWIGTLEAYKNDFYLEPPYKSTLRKLYTQIGIKYKGDL